MNQERTGKQTGQLALLYVILLWTILTLLIVALTLIHTLRGSKVHGETWGELTCRLLWNSPEKQHEGELSLVPFNLKRNGSRAHANNNHLTGGCNVDGAKENRL